MEPWQVNILIVVGLVFIVLFLPVEVIEPLLFVIIASSAVWVYIDAKKLNTEKYKRTFLSPPAWPFGAAFMVFMLWIIVFPMYISYRKKIINGEIPLKEVDSQKINNQGVNIDTENNN